MALRGNGVNGSLTGGLLEGLGCDLHAAVLAKGLVVAIEAGGLRAQRAAALDLIDTAGRAIGAELRRRQ